MIDSDLGSHKVNVYPKVHQYGRYIPTHNVWSINSSSHSRKAVYPKVHQYGRYIPNHNVWSINSSSHSRKAVYPKVHHNVSLLDMIFQYGR